MDQDNLDAAARAVIDANHFMVLGTVGDDGLPWVSPVYFASADYTRFYWISVPDAKHSVNVAQRPGVSVVVFDSQVLPGTGQGVYLSATAEQLTGAALDRALTIYPGPSAVGSARRFEQEELQAPGPFRMYCATASQHWILCPRTTGRPCELHGIAHDHRVAVNP